MTHWAASAVCQPEPAAVTDKVRRGEMTSDKLARYRWTRKQPLLRYALYRIAKRRTTRTAGQHNSSESWCTLNQGCLAGFVSFKNYGGATKVGA